MTCDDLLPVPADVDTRHLGGAVGVDGGQVNEPPRVHGCPRDLVEPNRTVSHRLSLMKTPPRQQATLNLTQGGKSADKAVFAAESLALSGRHRGRSSRRG